MAQPDLHLEALRPETRSAIEAAARALEMTRRGPAGAAVSAKQGRDIVTAADVAVEDTVRVMLTGALGVTVVGEERGGDAPVDGSPYWLVDPICGTGNFASGTPLYCVNLALIEQDQVAVAVVGDPSTDEIAIAESGRGAWALKDGVMRPLQVSGESRAVIVEEGKSKGPRREHAARFVAQAIRADRWDCRSLSTTLGMPYVAAGRMAAYVVFYVTAVHCAAGSLLVAEAGGRVTDLAGHPWTLASDSIIASGGAELHEELLQLARVTSPDS